MSSQILTEQVGQVGLIILNRPEKLNALTMEMYDGLDSHLIQWQSDPTIRAIIIRANGERAFCAGGDISAVYQNGPEKAVNSKMFFSAEYTMNANIFHCTKPYIALMHGFVMGGGMGVSVHGSHRVVDPNVVMAMPETGIGFFPDVGGSYFLSRCPGEIGTYLGLSGHRLSINDAHFCGLADYNIAYNQFDDIVEKIAHTDQSIDECLQLKSQPFEMSLLKNEQVVIDDCFAFDSVSEIFNALRAHPSSFAQDTLMTLQLKSPTSMKLTLDLLRKAKTISFNECMALENNLVDVFLQGSDFYEGIRAAVIDKDNKPNWQNITS